MDEPGQQRDDGESEPRVPIEIEQFLAAMAMAALCVITFANVVARYFTNFSFAFTEEYSIFLMVVMTLFGSAAAFAVNRHIRMTFVTDRLGAGARRAVDHLISALAMIMFGLLVLYGARVTLDDWRFETTSAGLGVPQWIYSMWLPILSALIVLRILGRAIRLWRARP